MFTYDSLTDVDVRDDISIVKSCDCVKCETESLLIESSYRGTACAVGAIYGHPNVNVSHFISDLESLLNQTDNDLTTVRHMNIDIVKLSIEDVVSYVTTLMPYGYLPYIKIQCCITYFSMTCIDILSGLFYCDIIDH